MTLKEFVSHKKLYTSADIKKLVAVFYNISLKDLLKT